jgi:hypothetical protein
MHERFEKLKNKLRSYFDMTAESEGQRQVKLLPGDVRRTLIYGTDEEFKDALSDIYTQQKLHKQRDFGEPGLKVITEIRGFMRDNPKPSNSKK